MALGCCGATVWGLESRGFNPHFHPHFHSPSPSQGGGSNRKNVAVSPNYEAIDGSLERYDPVEAIGAIIQCLLEGIITDAR